MTRARNETPEQRRARLDRDAASRRRRTGQAGQAGQADGTGELDPTRPFEDDPGQADGTGTGQTDGTDGTGTGQADGTDGTGTGQADGTGTGQVPGQAESELSSSLGRGLTDRREVSQPAPGAREPHLRSWRDRDRDRDRDARGTGRERDSDSDAEAPLSRSLLDEIVERAIAAARANDAIAAPDELHPTELARRRAARLDAKAAARDWVAIDACGLCDRNGFVTIEPSNGTGIPTVAFCSHRTTIEAAHARAEQLLELELGSSRKDLE